jgi:uncharacterized protein
MLIDFRVANHRSLRDEQVLTMEAGRVGDEADPRPRHVSGHAEPLLTVAGLYGANASGKSNVLAALAFMDEAVRLSHRAWAPDKGVPRDPFAWGPRKTEPSLFEVTLLRDGVRYQYGFSASDERFLEEWLYAWPNGKKQIWFERDGSTFKFGENLKGENKLIEGVTRPNALFLSAAAQHNHPQLQPLFLWLPSLRTINFPIGRRSLANQFQADAIVLGLIDHLRKQPQMPPEAKRYTKEAPEFVCNLLKRADLGIVDWRMREQESEREDAADVIFDLKHQSDSDNAWLPLDEESRGTQALFRLAWPVFWVLDNGGLLLIDELERSLHPALAREVIRQFNDPVANSKNAQIVFTTHDTNLLGTTVGEPALRRDQVWLTEKNPEGATVLYPLTDYKPRKAENLERGYLQGRYGAIPFLGDFLVAGETR